MKNFKSLYIALIGVVFLFLFVSTTEAQQKSIFDLMHYKDDLSLTLESDFEYIKENRRSEEYQKARLTFDDESGAEQVWDMKVRVRGNFRRLNCSDIPPLKLKFKKAELAAAGLASFNDMKLVTYCTADKNEAYELLMKEYLTYELFSEVSKNSYRVQLLRINFKDSNTGRKTKQWAFLIEDTAQLKARIGAVTAENIYNLPLERYYENDRKLVGLFQYIIGNSDWSYEQSRNVKMLEKDGKIIPVPYDFDFSGIVNASYAVPNPNYKMISRTERIFMGFEEDLADMHNALYQIYGRRQNLLDKALNFKYLSNEVRYEVYSYLKSYFDDFETIRPGVKKEIRVIDIANQYSE